MTSDLLPQAQGFPPPRSALAASGRVGDVLLYLNGSRRSFHCRCACNVFHMDGDVYVCNACGTRYEGEAS